MVYWVNKEDEKNDFSQIKVSFEVRFLEQKANIRILIEDKKSYLHLKNNFPKKEDFWQIV